MGSTRSGRTADVGDLALRGTAPTRDHRPQVRRCGRSFSTGGLGRDNALALVGLRSSEILGLARSDLDLVNGTVTIEHQVSGSGRKAVLVQTKTASSAATVPLPHFVAERLRDHLAKQDAERPIVPLGDSLVFVTEHGLAINGSWFPKHFQALLLRAGLPTMRLHDMRHGAASLLVDAGAHPRIAQ